jgi:hypothetical protein
MRILLLSIFLGVFLSIYSQETNNMSISVLEYKAEIPDTNSYEIIKNDSNLEIEESVLTQINFHRRHDEHFLWIVRDGLEILIYSIASLND